MWSMITRVTTWHVKIYDSGGGLRLSLRARSQRARSAVGWRVHARTGASSDDCDRDREGRDRESLITDVPYFLRRKFERVRLISFFIFFPSLFLAELMQKLSECARYTQSGNAKSLV